MVGTGRAFEVPLSTATLSDSLIAVWFGRGWGKPRRCALRSGRDGGTDVRKGCVEVQGAGGHASVMPVPTTGKFPLENIPLTRRAWATLGQEREHKSLPSPFDVCQN